MKKILNLILIFLSLNSIAADVIVEPSNDPLDVFLDEEEVSFQSIDSLSKKLSTFDQRYKKYTPKEFVRITPDSPVKFYAVLKERSQLVKLESSKVFFSKRKVYVSAREIYYGGNWSYIYNKKGEIKYKTLTRNLSSVEKIITLRSNISAEKTFPPKTRLHTSDKVFPLESHFLYRRESSDLGAIATALDKDSGAATSNSFSFKFYYDSFLPLDFGLVMDYQIGQISSEDGNTANWQAFYFGPTIKYDFLETSNFKFNSQFAVKKSLRFNASSDGDSVNYSALLWQVGLEAIYKTRIGNFSIGYESSFIRSSVKGELSEQETFNNEKTTMQQNAISIGYQYTWNL
ncbi:hypothetical protein A9Q84_04905 [Halobacteriovorax marinus]|uniref:Uncharacterized protein n=1 Tax=Halobacteriovorax marinus TaxID=97084 RepID=A0A1Y5FEX9_9BACT|nr:hypothetical protein A9Q84_04905 [Halobacteriovorax marinus]